MVARFFVGVRVWGHVFDKTNILWRQTALSTTNLQARGLIKPDAYCLLPDVLVIPGPAAVPVPPGPVANTRREGHGPGPGHWHRGQCK